MDPDASNDASTASTDHSTATVATTTTTTSANSTTNDNSNESVGYYSSYVNDSDDTVGCLEAISSDFPLQKEGELWDGLLS